MIGEQLGNYKITGKIGEGGMGVVYVAVHQSIGRKAAIKVLLPELSKNADVVQRFFNEARATTLIKHPGLVDIFDFGNLPDGSAYIAMEFLEGESLAAAIKRSGPMTLSRVVAIGRQIAAALAAAHEKGIIHRDLKPDNIFLVPDDEASGGARVKILDFGIAKLATGNAGVSGLKTRTGMMMGTPVYMSPEQCKSSGEVDHRSDIYALGCVLYEMACGRPPFVKEGFGEIIGAHLYEQPEAPRSLVPGMSPVLESVLLKSLTKKVDDRQQSMSQLKSELDALVTARLTHEGPVTGAPRVAVTVARTVVPSLAANTTLGEAAVDVSEIRPAPPKTSRGWMIGVASGVIAVAAVGLIASRVRRDGPQPLVPADKKSAATTVSPNSNEAAQGSANALLGAAPKRVRLTIDSEPAGATVYRAVDGVKLGVTPKELDLESSGAVAQFALRLDGYHLAKIELPGDRDGSSRVRLSKETHPAPAGKSAVSPLPLGGAAPPHVAPPVVPAEITTATKGQAAVPVKPVTAPAETKSERATYKGTKPKIEQSFPE